MIIYEDSMALMAFLDEAKKKEDNYRTTVASIEEGMDVANFRTEAIILIKTGMPTEYYKNIVLANEFRTGKIEQIKAVNASFE